MKKHAIILSTGSASRSHMAAALWRRLGGEEWDAQAACSGPNSFAHPIAVLVMRELGVDLRRRRNRHLHELRNQRFDLCVTVSEEPNEQCPSMPESKLRLSWSIPDPERVRGAREERMDAFRIVRDQLAERILQVLHTPRE